MLEAFVPVLGGEDRPAQLAAFEFASGGADHEPELVLDAIEEKARKIGVVTEIDFLLLVAHLVQWRLGDEEVSAIDELFHLAVEEGQKQGPDMRTVDIGIGHDDDLVVADLEGIELVLADPGAEALDQRTNLLRRQHAVKTRLLDIEDLAAQRQDRLKSTVPPLFCRAARRITLDDEELAELRVALRTVRELTRQRRALEGALAAGEFARFSRGLPRAGRIETFV